MPVKQSSNEKGAEVWSLGSSGSVGNVFSCMYIHSVIKDMNSYWSGQRFSEAADQTYLSLWIFEHQSHTRHQNISAELTRITLSFCGFRQQCFELIFFIILKICM